LAHEMAHDGNTAGSHVHGPEFKDRYYEITYEKTYYRNPLFHAFSFIKAMQQCRIDEKMLKEADANKARMDKLGIGSTDNVAASSKK